MPKSQKTDSAKVPGARSVPEPDTSKRKRGSKKATPAKTKQGTSTQEIDVSGPLSDYHNPRRPSTLKFGLGYDSDPETAAKSLRQMEYRGYLESEGQWQPNRDPVNISYIKDYYPQYLSPPLLEPQQHRGIHHSLASPIIPHRMILHPIRGSPLHGENSPPIAIFQSLTECHACLEPHHYQDLQGLNPSFLGHPVQLPRYTCQALPIPSTYWTMDQYQQRNRPDPIVYGTVDTCYYLKDITNMLPSPYDDPRDADNTEPQDADNMT
jgi:hypothetical protein